MFLVVRFMIFSCLFFLFNAQAQLTLEQKEQKVAKEKVKDKSLVLSLKNKGFMPKNNSDEDWANIVHDHISDSVYQSAYWFDRFFSADNNEQETPKTSARIRFGWLPKRTNLSKMETRFQVKLTLPNLQNKVDVIFSDDSDNTLTELPLEAYNSQQAFTKESFSAALRYINRKDENIYTDTRIGFSAGDLFVRLRHKQRYTWNEIHGVKIEPAIFYFIGDGLGARLLLEYNYQVNHTDQYRVNYSIRASESFKGRKWKYGLYYLMQLDNKKAAAFGLVTNGKYGSEQGSFIDKYKLSYRYRFNALKSWLFFEVEPFLEWTKEDNFTTDPGVALRIEGFFQKK